MTVSQMPAKPSRGKRPAAAAREAEAKDGHVAVEACGITLSIPTGQKIPFRAVLRFRGLNDDLTPLGDNEDGDLLGTAIMLGPEQWSELLEKNPTTEDFNAITWSLQAALGN